MATKKKATKKKVKARNPAGAKRSGTEKGKEAARKGKQAGKVAAKRSKNADKAVKKAKANKEAVSEESFNARRTINKKGEITGRKKISEARNEELNYKGNRASDKVWAADKKRNATPAYSPPKKKSSKKGKK